MLGYKLVIACDTLDSKYQGDAVDTSVALVSSGVLKKSKDHHGTAYSPLCYGSYARAYAQNWCVCGDRRCRSGIWWIPLQKFRPRVHYLIWGFLFTVERSGRYVREGEWNRSEWLTTGRIVGITGNDGVSFDTEGTLYRALRSSLLLPKPGQAISEKVPAYRWRIINGEILFSRLN